MNENATAPSGVYDFKRNAVQMEPRNRNVSTSVAVVWLILGMIIVVAFGRK